MDTSSMDTSSMDTSSVDGAVGQVAVCLLTGNVT